MEGEGGAQRVRGGGSGTLIHCLHNKFGRPFEPNQPKRPVSETGRIIFRGCPVATPWPLATPRLPRGYPAATPWMPSVAEAPTGPPGSFSRFTCVYQECAENQSGMRPKLLSFWAHPALVLGPRQKGRGSPVTLRGYPVGSPWLPPARLPHS